MWNVQYPTITAEEAFQTSISRIADLSLRTRLTGITTDIVEAETDYTTCATTAALHTFPQSGVVGTVTKSELVDVYDHRMAKKGAPARSIYDKLLAAPEHGRCPFCGQRRVATLDHHLPKSSYPILAVTPVNLVPSCRDCNTEKLAVAPDSADHVFLHPYFDVVDQQRWLVATVLDSNPPIISFSINPDAFVNEITRARVEYQFARLKLASLYSTHAAEELASIRWQLRRIFASAGADAVKAHLRDTASSNRAARRNSWQTAMYTALVENDKYCAGGFEF